MTQQGKIMGVGLGPGAQDLMSLRASKLVTETKYIAYFRKKNRSGHARTIVEGMLREDVLEIPMVYPVTTEIPFTDPRYNELLAAFYQDCTQKLLDLSAQGHDVVVLCEGDPFFYGSFMHLYTRLLNQVEITVVPGITGMSAAWTATNMPMSWGDDVLTVIMGTMPADSLIQQMQQADALVIMKLGKHLAKVKAALQEVGKLERAWLIEYAAMDNQRVTPLPDASDVAPYFAIVIVHGQGRRP